MSDTGAYENDLEREQHLKAMHALARDLGMTDEDIKNIYEGVLCRIRDGAKIKDYLAVLVCHHVKALMRRGGAAGASG